MSISGDARSTNEYEGAQLLTSIAAIDEHGDKRVTSPLADTFIAVVESRPFLRECIRRSMDSALSVPVVTYSTLSDLGAQLQEGAAGLIVLSLIEATSEACANALKSLA